MRPASTLAPNERWNFGANSEHRHADRRADRREDRSRGRRHPHAVTASAVQLSSAVEFRFDKTEQPNAESSERTTWLFRNSFKFQLDPDWRIVGKFNSRQERELARAVLRRRLHRRRDRLRLSPRGERPAQALAKYTYFYNVPTTEQVTPHELGRAVHAEEPHRGARSHLRPHRRLVDRRQVRLSPRTGEPGPRATRSSSTTRAQLYMRARRLAVREVGRPGRRTHARPAGSQRTAPRRAGRASTATSASTSRSAPATTSPTSRKT